jgi:hypothetical protein
MSMPLLSAIAAVLLAAGPTQVQTPKLDVPPVVPNRVYVVEQVVTQKLPQPILAQLQPLKTLRQVEELLKANSVPYGWRKGNLNTAALPPAVAKQIESLPPGEVFVIPSGENLTMNVIVGRR